MLQSSDLAGFDTDTPSGLIARGEPPRDGHPVDAWAADRRKRRRQLRDAAADDDERALRDVELQPLRDAANW